MQRHFKVLKIMAAFNDAPLDDFLTAAKTLGYLDKHSRPTDLGVRKGLYQLDYTKPQIIINYNDDFETYIHFHGEIPIIVNIKISDRSILVDAEAFAILTGYNNALALMTDNNIVLDIMNMVPRDTGQSLMERANIDGAEKEYFKIGLYNQWAKEFIKNN